MTRSSLRSLHAFLLSVLLFASCAEVTTIQEVGKTVPAQVAAPLVMWGEPVNGLMLGVERPKQVLLFTPGKGWNSLPYFTVHLKNVSSEDVFWTDYPFTWKVSFFDEESGELKPDPFPYPPPTVNPPRRLRPNDQTAIRVPISVGASWKRVIMPEGKCSAIITYSPDNYRNMSIGGKQVLHVPGFWTGTISSPKVSVLVKHSAQQRNERRLGHTRCDCDHSGLFLALDCNMSAHKVNR